MPCCGGHGSGHRQPPPLLVSRTQGPGFAAGDALLNLSVLKTLSEHVDAATAVSCYSVCRAWREAFGLSCLNSTLCTSEPVDGTRSRFAANLHGAVTLEVTQPAEKAQRGFERHIAALSRNRHFLQLKVHLPVREAGDPQLSLGGLSNLQPLTQLTSLVISRNPAFTSAPHNLSEDDVNALSSLRSLTFLELCTAVPPPLGLDKLAGLATGFLTQLRTLAFGHTSALWRIPEVARLCQLLDVCPLLTDLRLRCCAPPKDSKQLPDLMALPLPQRLTNFALTFARRLGRGEGGHAGGVGHAAPGAHIGVGDDGDDDAEARYGEYEDLDDPWDSVDHLAPKPGLHVLIVEKGTRVTRMDINVTITVSAAALPTISLPGSRQQRKSVWRRRRGVATAAAAAPGRRVRRVALPDSDCDSDDNGDGDGGAADEEDVPPYDVTPMVLAEYQRLLQQELGLSGSLAEPEDLHLGVRVDILEDEEEGLAAAAAAAVNNIQQQMQGGPAPLQVLAHLHAALNAMQQQQHNGNNNNNNDQHQPQMGLPMGLAPALAAAAAGGGGGGGGGGLPGQLPPAIALLLNHMAQLHLGGGGGAAGNNNNNNNNGAAVADGTQQQQQHQNANQQQQHHHHHPGGAGGADRGAAAPLAARVLQLQLGPLSPHMCYLNLALVPMVTQLAMVAQELGPNGEEVIQPPQPPADTKVAPVLLDLRGGGYTQLKSLAITGYVDQDCRPAAWMSRGWLAHIPAGMPSLEYLALYDTLPAAANDPTAIEGLRALSHLEHLELRPLYLRFTAEVPCPLSAPPPVLPPKLLQLTLKKVTIPASPSPPPHLPAGAAAPSSSPAALALLPDLSTLTHLWLFDCVAPDLLVFRRATRLEDLRLGGTTTTTRLSDLLPCFPCLRGLIMDCSYTVAPGWWSAKQMSSLLGLRCLRSLQIDAASLEPPPAATAASRAAGSSSLRTITLSYAAGASGSGGPAARKPQSRASGSATAHRIMDSDDDSDEYLSTEEESLVHLSSGGGGGVAAGLNSGTATASGDETLLDQAGAGAAGPQNPGGSGAAARSDGPGGDEVPGASGEVVALSTSKDSRSDLASVMVVLSGLTQLTDLTLSFDTPTLFLDEDEEDEEEENDEDDADTDADDDSYESSGLAAAAGAAGGAGPSMPGAASQGAKRGGGGDGGGGGAGSSGSAAGRRHTERVYDALLSVHSFVALTALRGLWRLRIGLPHGTLWEDVTSRLLPILRIAMDKTCVEMDVL
ncbi:hypothetical protein VOLCADRAFT_103913 [Volvox carteri f. nagariensis]|uniref:Uncharacterized protein n=1 Tax=Volvox carteri f. nagariensis TaxID=3068 RepID=D8TQ19_VOLCA|nr:uncharacterized protein VOLCADRAFT_103913 [Volvox carteri f. nagariensis]EFJ50325.1 hypothetical protein VOLCADRAFT_103913 [Volvox carteri f. nagariensis]|eukprot:XP_002948450.1 hypothetical protein VOLCADRAFT_103913 [Volvox carteri f. nagariensis]